MEHVISIRVAFDAHHVNPKVDRCARNHGHRWEVVVEALGDAAAPESNKRLEADLISVVTPWVDKSLNEIANSGDPWQVAAWIVEMLSLNHPNIMELSLSDGRTTSIVHRSPR